jgi:AraC family transcriptional regulator, arabinose operon regulatory protein
MFKKEGFKGQRAIVLPNVIQDELKTWPLTKLLFVTDIGFYPNAQYHYRERPSGSEQNILIYCIEGDGWVEVKNNRKKVQKDQFFIIPAHIPHKYGVDNSEPWTIYWLHFTGTNAESLLQKGFSVINIEPDGNTDHDRRIGLFEEIYNNLSMGFSKENLEYSSLSLWHLLGTFNYMSQFKRVTPIVQTDFIGKSILYMHQHIDKKINLSDLADHCGLSVSHYSMIFKKRTYRTPIQYFNNLKIQKACQMLDFTDMHIKEISIHLDFEDQFYFSRVFKKEMGLPPIEYRKNKKG